MCVSVRQLLLALLLLLLLSLATTLSTDTEKMDTMELIETHGFVSQQHQVITEDGYVLTLHRIMRQSGPRRPPVLLQHGILCSSACWVLRGTQKELAIMLVEAGYDVWLGNVRGNTYCKSHLRLDNTMEKFWNYSFHEMGNYDVPAMIDYILAESGQDQLFYVGHSMGTTMFYVMCACRPQYNAKNLLTQHRIYEVVPTEPWLSSIEANLCRDGSPFQTFCVEIAFAIIGRDYTQFNKSMLPMIVEHMSSTNPRTLAHYGQLINSGRFQWYNWGPEENLAVYGSREPPDYDLSLITAPVSLHYSTNDPLSFEKDVKNLAARLPNVIGVFKVPNEHFNHIDFLLGTDADSLLYKDIVHLMKKL
ncbi:lipase 1-like isoform X2 [Homalodisca vitripennis]|uniref:lipase 1-like isoform X2 n=1 Tax=Homalodisca vitripennis TaxID=197043 RepID=UPI001EEA2629|nr:lipase 1-like isoform X2 [Homalodisca vitripennis]